MTFELDAFWLLDRLRFFDPLVHLMSLAFNLNTFEVDLRSSEVEVMELDPAEELLESQGLSCVTRRWLLIEHA